MKITYLAAISADGFIARADGDVAWLDESQIDKDPSELEQFFAGVDGLMMGRNTYDFVFNYGTWPYEDKPTWICTHRTLIPMESANLIVVDNIDDMVAGVHSNGLKHLWLVGGGLLASSLLDKGLITNLSLTELPIKLNTGIPLFANHRWQEIDCKEKNVLQRTGFRQIETVIAV